MKKLLSKPLSNEETDKILARKLAWILGAVTPTKVIVFGSAATYEMSDSSDVDLVLLFDSADEMAASKKPLRETRPPDDWDHDLMFAVVEEFEFKSLRMGHVFHTARTEGRILFARDSSTQ